MRIKKRIFVSLLTAFALLLLGCPDLVNTDSEKSFWGPVWEEPLTHEEFLALSHLDEYPVRVEGIVDDDLRSVGGVQRSTVTTTQGDDDRYYRYKLQIIPYLKPSRS
jgi:hypothetical protein